MAWTTPSTLSARDRISAAFWNEQVRDNQSFLYTPPMVKAVRTSDTAYTANTDITWQSVATVDRGYDTDAMWDSGDPTKITIKTAGIYQFTFQWFLTGSSLANIQPFIRLAAGPTTIAEHDQAPAVNTQALGVVAAAYELSVNDVITARVNFTGTGTLKGTTVRSYLACHWVGKA